MSCWVTLLNYFVYGPLKRNMRVRATWVMQLYKLRNVSWENLKNHFIYEITLNLEVFISRLLFRLKILLAYIYWTKPKNLSLNHHNIDPLKKSSRISREAASPQTQRLHEFLISHLDIVSRAESKSQEVRLKLRCKALTPEEEIMQIYAKIPCLPERPCSPLMS